MTSRRTKIASPILLPSYAGMANDMNPEDTKIPLEEKLDDSQDQKWFFDYLIGMAIGVAIMATIAFFAGYF